MNDIQKIKRNFRNTKAFKEHKAKKKKEFGGLDKITMHKLRKGWSLHHEDLNEEHYKILNDNFLPCNNLTHKFIHWIWRYYETDEGIIDRLKAELEKMAEINRQRTIERAFEEKINVEYIRNTKMKAINEGGKGCELEKVNKAENKV